jgi:hypothetical protein
MSKSFRKENFRKSCILFESVESESWDWFVTLFYYSTTIWINVRFPTQFRCWKFYENENLIEFAKLNICQVIKIHRTCRTSIRPHPHNSEFTHKFYVIMGKTNSNRVYLGFLFVTNFPRITNEWKRKSIYLEIILFFQKIMNKINKI